MPPPLLTRVAQSVLPASLYARARTIRDEAPCLLGERLGRGGAHRRSQARGLFVDRRVALVGPSPSIVGLRQGAHIDGHDLTARLNSALPLDPGTAGDLGSRCEVLFSSLHVNRRNAIDPGVPIDPQAWIDAGVQQLVCGYPRWHPAFRQDVGEYFRNHGSTLPFAWVSRADHQEQCRRLGARPTTGYAAIRFLLDQPITELFITGFTFMRDGYQKTYREVSTERAREVVKTVGVHDPESELQDLRRIAAADPRVKLDTVLQRIFDAEHPL